MSERVGVQIRLSDLLLSPMVAGKRGIRKRDRRERKYREREREREREKGEKVVGLIMMHNFDMKVLIFDIYFFLGKANINL